MVSKQKSKTQSITASASTASCPQTSFSNFLAVRRRINNKMQPADELCVKSGFLEPQLKKKTFLYPYSPNSIFGESFCCSGSSNFRFILPFFFLSFFRIRHNYMILLSCVFYYVMCLLWDREKKSASQFFPYWHQWLLAHTLFRIFLLIKGSIFSCGSIFYFFWASSLFLYFFSLCSPSNSFLALN